MMPCHVSGSRARCLRSARRQGARRYSAGRRQRRYQHRCALGRRRLWPSPGEVAAGQRQTSLHQFVSRQVLSAYAAADEFSRQQLPTQTDGGEDYPDTQLGSRLKLVSQLLKSNSQARVFYTMQSGYDTHSAQLYTHSRLLQEFSTAIKSFLDDLQPTHADGCSDQRACHRRRPVFCSGLRSPYCGR